MTKIPTAGDLLRQANRRTRAARKAAKTAIPKPVPAAGVTDLFDAWDKETTEAAQQRSSTLTPQQAQKQALFESEVASSRTSNVRATQSVPVSYWLNGRLASSQLIKMNSSPRLINRVR